MKALSSALNIFLKKVRNSSSALLLVLKSLSTLRRCSNRTLKLPLSSKSTKRILLDGGDKDLYDDFLDDAITESILAIYSSGADGNASQDNGAEGGQNE